MQKCPNCAQEIHDDAMHCTHCGAMLSAPPPGVYEGQATPGSYQGQPSPGQPYGGPYQGQSYPGPYQDQPYPGPYPDPGGQGPPGGQPDRIKNYLVQSILATLFCCMIPGIVAIVYSTQVDPKKRIGDWAGAQAASRAALTWCWAAVGVGCLVVLLQAAILVPNFIRARAHGQHTACKSNLKNIGTALEMWSTDNEGRYPDSLSQLCPNYLRVLPTCPTVGHETYSRSYEHSEAVTGLAGDKRTPAYTVCCSGSHHEQVGEGNNYPMYTSTQGLVTQ